MNLILRAVVTFTFLGSFLSLHAQTNGVTAPPGAKLVPQRNFAICFLYALGVPELYFLNANGDYAPLKVDTTRFDSWNVIPATSELTLFSKKETPEVRFIDPITKKAIVTPATTSYELARKLLLPAGLDSFRKLFYYASNGSVKEMDIASSDQSFVSGQARVLNLLDQTVAILLGKERKQIAGGQQNTITVSADSEGNFNFQYGVEIPDSPVYISPAKTLKFNKPTQRLWIIMGNLPVSQNDEKGATKFLGFQPNPIRVYEDTARLPVPPMPAIVYPKK